jgi:ribosome-associated protein
MINYIFINRKISIPFSELKFKSVRSGGPGGQHVNKVETAVQLRFDIGNSSLPEEVKELILATGDKRISKKKVLVIRSENSRSQELNREEAIGKLIAFIKPILKKEKRRIRTNPTKASKEKKKVEKMIKSKIKKNRKSPKLDFE